jgi:hypothetical protein
LCSRAVVAGLGSDAGGERAAVIYTVLQSAKLNGLDPEAYLADIIDRMAKGHPVNRLSELLPGTGPKMRSNSQPKPRGCWLTLTVNRRYLHR